MNLIYGTHAAFGDENQYEYDATWRRGPAGLTWNATVYKNRRIALHPSGIMFGTEAAAGESSVRRAITSAIERRMYEPKST